ncbi:MULTISPECIES: sulfur carrier protein ThiS [Corynebacterium]|uniref:Thiamine biosynthesis protein ThiS n=3 Tax=Corynebacterium TaxID=1716 RepID=A0ACC4UBK2_9CORY|nr:MULTISPECIES: sulfur carrier protein ThiS [Corynebacterium]KKO80290.1 thiamine biosynthesis protein ThiS [Corynebacterium minutissimum]OFK66247.1 thiamine biosynthesis protein ThiS [Corynebacterium sp. HMSC074A09]OFK70061.1 thiamine biosynthesis protein ThiS [Corynebacterium sp. HMSC076G08]OFN38606.1 thiamine biosynthesis protein ThiS [Corynebacterium sp. HMSC072A04]OFN76729.1 thiamine biosynthesis protein ThiS [Corynebacterium sp. HMSC070E08]
MILIFNGQPYDTAADTVAQLLEEKGIDADGTAVALSEQVVPRSQWESTPLTEGATVEVLTAVQGG